MTCWRTNDDFKAKHSRWLLLSRHWSGRSCPWCCPRNVARTTFARSVLSSHPFSNRQYKQLPSPSMTYWKDKDGSLKIEAVKKGNRQSSPREWDGNKKCEHGEGLLRRLRTCQAFSTMNDLCPSVMETQVSQVRKNDQHNDTLWIVGKKAVYTITDIHGWNWTASVHSRSVPVKMFCMWRHTQCFWLCTSLALDLS